MFKDQYPQHYTINIITQWIANKLGFQNSFLGIACRSQLSPDRSGRAGQLSHSSPSAAGSCAKLKIFTISKTVIIPRNSVLAVIIHPKVVQKHQSSSENLCDIYLES